MSQRRDDAATNAGQITQTESQDVLSTGPSASYMEARIRTLTRMLISRFGDILDVALEDTDPSSDPNDHPPPSLVQTADKQLTVDVATMQMIRAAEELMVLTRTMKELWLFGDLDTVVADQSPEEKEKTRMMREDEVAVVKGMREWLRGNGEKFDEATARDDDASMSDG